MADKMVALVGPGTGPLMHTSRMGQLLVKLRELTDGQVKITSDNAEAFFVADCDVSLNATGCVRVEYKGRNKKFMCIIQTHPDALHRARPDGSSSGPGGNTGSSVDEHRQDAG